MWPTCLERRECGFGIHVEIKQLSVEGPVKHGRMTTCMVRLAWRSIKEVTCGCPAGMVGSVASELVADLTYNERFGTCKSRGSNTTL